VFTQAVDDVLAACIRAGLVRRIEPAGQSGLDPKAVEQANPARSGAQVKA
jgi:hypothetical protein